MKRSIALLALASAAFADKKPVTLGRAANDTVLVEATIHVSKDDIAKAVGAPLDEGILVVELTVTPRNEQKVKVERDDFVLLSTSNGQRSTPFAPTQIAGSAAMVVSSKAGGAVMSENRQRPWGGLGGMGGPMGLPGSGGTVGSATAGVSEATVKTVEGDGKENPLLALLKQKILPEKEIAEPLSGQLYFLIEGKQKLKDLELYYRSPGGRLTVKFAR